MINFNTDVVFVDESGQVRCQQGDLFLKPSVSGKVIIRQRTDISGQYTSLVPEIDGRQNIGEPLTRWNGLFAVSGVFQSLSISGLFNAVGSSGNFGDITCNNIIVYGQERAQSISTSSLIVTIDATITNLALNGTLDMQGNTIQDAGTIIASILDMSPGGIVDLGSNGRIDRCNIINTNILRVHSSGSMKTLAMSGNIDMGGSNIVTVGLVDGVDISDHSARHEIGGADEINVNNLNGELASAQKVKVTDDITTSTYSTTSFPTPAVTVDGSVYFGFTVTDQLTFSQVDINTNAASVLFNAFKGGAILRHTTLRHNFIQEGHFINLSGISTSGTLNMLNRGIVNVSGIIMSTSGNIIMNSGIISGLSLTLPTAPSQATSKKFVDDRTWFTPSGETYYFDDFIIDRFYRYGEVTASGGGGYNPVPFDSSLMDEDHMGIFRVYAGAQANGFDRLYAWPQTISIGAGDEIESILKPRFGSTGMRVQFGLGSSTGTGENSDGLWLEFNQGTANWIMVSARDGSIHKTTSSRAVEIDLFTTLKITTSISGTNPTNNLVANYWVNDSLIGQKTNNIPSGAVTTRLLHPFWMVTQNGVNGFCAVEIDRWAFRKFKLR